MTPTTMRAAVLHAAGPPDAFQIETLPVTTPGAEDVLVRVMACGVSFHDIVERNGVYRRDVEFPLVMGLEISGIVEALGVAVRDLRVGDHVCSKAFASCGRCRLCRGGRETTCSERRPVRGGYSEYTAVPWDALVRVPDGIPFNVSCTLGPAAGVALNAVRDVANVRLGENVLVTGGTGGVGLPCVQIAKVSGARVIAVTRSESKRAMLKAAGADEVIVSPTNDDFSPAVRELTGSRGVDVIIDNVGSSVFDACFKSLARHGRFTLIGQLSGDEVSINLARIFFKRASFLGVGSVSRAQLEDVIKLTAEGKVRPQVAAGFPLEEVARAHALVESGERAGRIVLNPATTGVPDAGA